MAIQTILVPTDFSESAERAGRAAVMLAAPRAARIHLLHVVHLPVVAVTPEAPVAPVEFWRELVLHGETALQELKARLEAQGARSVTTEVVEDVPGFAISAAAKRLKADLIVMGSRGLSGVKHLVFGSVAERTVRTASCPVLTLKAGGPDLALRTILVATDFSPFARRALELAKELARGARVILVHAYYIPVELEPYLLERSQPAVEQLSKAAADELQAELKAAGVDAEYLAVRGAPDEVILRVAKERGVDLIALGTHGRRGLSHLLLGSVAERVVRGAECPVLTAQP